ncbi:MAG: hypothetical protein L6405_08080 [Actinomycetia bacterium]|nr:hypothetical protein [Actinomycetes bacterium]
MKKIIFYLTLFWLIASLFPGRSFAACNFYQSMTATTKSIPWSSVCTISAVEGIDDAANNEASATNIAALTLSTGTAITINDTGKLYVGSLVLSGGTVAILTGGEIKIGAPLYVADADADGWATDFSLLTATASGQRRLSLMQSFTTIDCGASTHSAANSCCGAGDTPSTVGSELYGTTCKKCVSNALTNQTSAEDLFSQCTASYNACSGNNRIGPDGNCNGAAACNTGGLSDACPANSCSGGCSAGSCVAITTTWTCDTCCATCCTEHSNCGGTCSGCASGPFSGCSNYDVWNAAHTCYCSYCQINYSCAPCSDCNCSCR